MQTKARYYDGRTAASVETTLHFSGLTLSWDAPTGSQSVRADQVALVEPVGKGAWRIDLADGAVLEIDDPAFASEIARGLGQSNFASRLEGSWPYAIAALVVAVVGFWAIITWGVPAASKHVAFSLPPSYDAILAEDGLGVLDQVLFDPSELTVGTQERLQAHFREIQAMDPDFGRYRLEFRRADAIGPNAFAVPGGLVVMTDAMVELAENDDELIAVLAHEVGHQANRHSLRILLQNSATAVLFAALTGDLTGVTALSGALPTVLVQAKYSRDFEREADEFAFRYLDQKGIDSGVLSGLLLRLEEGGGADVPGWLSTHPSSKERVPAAN